MIRSRTLSLALLSSMIVVSVPAPAVAAPRVTSTIDVGSSPVSVAFSPNGKTAYVANSGADTVSVINVKTGTVQGHLFVGDGPHSVAFTPNGKTAYVANSNSGTVSVIKTR
jgi:YVTN family beta-propeller protein